MFLLVGYAGHVPFYKDLAGNSYPSVTNQALKMFTDDWTRARQLKEKELPGLKWEKSSNFNYYTFLKLFYMIFLKTCMKMPQQRRVFKFKLQVLFFLFSSRCDDNTAAIASSSDFAATESLSPRFLGSYQDTLDTYQVGVGVYNKWLWGSFRGWGPLRRHAPHRRLGGAHSAVAASGEWSPRFSTGYHFAP